MKTEVLELSGISVSHGRIPVIRNMSLQIHEKETYALIGANGAGKTTLANAIIGLLKCQSGSISFLDVDVTNQPPHLRASMGMGFVPEGRRLFLQFTVYENIRLGAYRKGNNDIERQIRYVYDLFPALESLRDRVVSNLSGGEQQMVAIARALMSEPKLLILDEPSTGLMPTIISRLFETIRKLKASMSILLIEQSARKALQVTDRAGVMQNGQIIIEGDPADLATTEMVKKAYLGA